MNRGEEEQKILMKLETHDLGCRYKKSENIRCFKNKVIVFGSTFYNIHYDIIEIFYFIYKCRQC